jgi:hypothetical protein
MELPSSTTKTRTERLTKFKDASGDDLVTNISRNIASDYKYVDPGTLSVQLYNTASRKNIGNFNVADLPAGKIYSLYFGNASDGSLSINMVLHN